jgi:CitMHS family citrate-Mg2+:H+ or citrate-Ca2+:H+ symporter
MPGIDLAVLGFLTIGVFLGLVLLTRTPVILALVAVPVVAALLAGLGGEIGGFSADGLRMVAPIAAMMMFAVLYFGLMMDAGLFEPLVRALSGAVRNDPVRLCLVTALLPMLVALDGDGATTFLIAVTALLPVHRRLGLNPLVLPTIVGLSAGVMNLLPWGGPTARAMTVLNAGVGDMFLPVLPAMAAGIAWVLFAAWWMGRAERKRLAVFPAPEFVEPLAPKAPPGSLPKLFWFNLALTTGLVVLLFHGLDDAVVPLPALPPALLFMAAYAIALPVNRRSLREQQDQLAAHAPSVVLVVSMIFAAGVFTGILGGSGMIQAMAQQTASVIPPGLAPWLSQIVAATSMPMSFIFTPDAYYFGVLPVFAESASAMGEDPLAIGRAAILGQMTTGFPLSPLTASTFILIGLSQVTLRDHQKHMFPWAFGTTLVMTLVAWATGAI